jgi:CelD/BcsL family acetyltransferase involved in cellulose biosynthesis
VSVTEKSGNPVMMIPLGMEKHRGIRFLGFLDGGVADYNAPVLFGAAEKLDHVDIRNLWNAICRAAPPFDVVAARKNSAICRRLQESILRNFTAVAGRSPDTI